MAEPEQSIESSEVVYSKVSDTWVEAGAPFACLLSLWNRLRCKASFQDWSFSSTTHQTQRIRGINSEIGTTLGTMDQKGSRLGRVKPRWKGS